MIKLRYIVLSVNKVISHTIKKESISQIRKFGDRNFATVNLYATNDGKLENHLAIPLKFSGQIRQYAKGKDKKKEKGKAKVQVSESEIAELINVDAMKSQMEKAVEKMKEDFIKNLSLRSSAGSIESVVVNIDGADHTLQELAQIVRKNPKLIVMNMAVFPQAIPAALKALEKSGMNLNPQQEGTTIYIPVPQVTKDHRENLAKNAKSLFIRCRDAIKEVQNKNIKTIKRKTGVSEDLVKSVEQQIQTLSDNFVTVAEKIMVKKQQELLGS